jgi:hypothetical protein
MFLFSQTQCTDKRDRIFSLLAIEPNGDARRHIRVDYDIRVSELWLDCAIYTTRLAETKHYRGKNPMPFITGLMAVLQLTRDELTEVIGLMTQRIRSFSPGELKILYKACASVLLRILQDEMLASPISNSMRKRGVEVQMNANSEDCKLLLALEEAISLVAGTVDESWQEWRVAFEADPSRSALDTQVILRTRSQCMFRIYRMRMDDAVQDDHAGSEDSRQALHIYSLPPPQSIGDGRLAPGGDGVVLPSADIETFITASVSHWMGLPPLFPSEPDEPHESIHV